MVDSISIPDWPRAHGGPAGEGRIRCSPDDFIVNERSGFEPSGSGEHVFVQIQKSAENTDYVARQLAKFSSVTNRDVSYAGLKDRHALTTQWFSVWLPGKEEPDWAGFETENIRILQSIRHQKKLKRGALSGNDFILTVRDWSGDKGQLEQILMTIKNQGVPNYFGTQRFGRAGRNVENALRMFKGVRVKRQQRSIYLSAARSFLFNEILASRIQKQQWNQAVSGDTFIFDQSGSYFKSAHMDESIHCRLNSGTIHPTGVLWGKGEIDVFADALAIETAVLKRYPAIMQGLADAAVAMGRRALRVKLQNLRWQFIGAADLQLAFFLPAGSYATSVLREMIKT